MTPPSFIGIDIGRSAVKAVGYVNGACQSILFPSAVSKAAAVVFEQIAQRAAMDTVEYRGDVYWTGDTALMQNLGAEPIGRSDDWVAGAAHDVLVLSAVARLRERGVVITGDSVITLGVPSRVFRDRRDLLNTVTRNVADLLRTSAGAPRVFVQAQPMGVIAHHTLDTEGFMQEGRSIEEDSYAVVEVGQFTTDFTAVVRGQPIIEATASCEGVELIATHLRAALRARDITLGSVDLQSLLTAKRIRVRGEDIDLTDLIDQGISTVFLPRVLESLQAAFTPALLQTVDQVLVAGGGGSIVVDALKGNAQTRHSALVHNSRLAVADGFARLSAMIHAVEAPQPA